MSRGDRQLTRRFWSETPLRALWPLLAGVFFHAREPLPTIFDLLVELARAHGPQQDDRTLLLVRFGDSTEPAVPTVAYS